MDRTENKYPIIGVSIITKKSFIIHSIDFENQTVFNRTSQDCNGNSYSFDDIYIMNEKNSSIEDFLFNSFVNYENYVLINGDETIYDNEYHGEIDEKRKEKIRKEKEKQLEIEKHNAEINKKIELLESKLK